MTAVNVRLPHLRSYLTEHCGEHEFATLAGYSARGGYETARRLLRTGTPDALIEEVRAAGLRSRGGAGHPTATKWGFMPRADERDGGPSYAVCNADASEPGSFRDRLLIERAPHLLLEGLLLAAWAVGAERSFIYIRGAYAHGARVLEDAIREAREAGHLGRGALGSGFDHDMVLVRGAGGTICGEDTGLLESLEGRVGKPRRKPPYPEQEGVFGRPTTVDDVETLCHVTHIAAKGAEWFRGFGTTQSPGTRVFGVSGHVVRPGLFELPLGTPLDELVFEHARGVPAPAKLKAVIPGGVSMPVLPAGQLDVALTQEALTERQSGLGTGGVIVMDEHTCMVRVGCVIESFFRDESCGQCTQCREGTGWLHRLLLRIERGAGRREDLAVLEDVASKMEGQTICGFADAAAWPVQGLLRHFREDFERHILQRTCPFRGSFVL